MGKGKKKGKKEKKLREREGENIVIYFPKRGNKRGKPLIHE